MMMFTGFTPLLSNSSIVKALTEPEKQYWQSYLNTSPAGLSKKIFVEASYAGNQSSTDQLLALYLSGKKTAGSSMAEDFTSSGEPLPQVGNFWILLNSLDEPSCILRTERVVLTQFKNVSEEIARAEGEGDLSLQHWRDSHRRFFAPFLAGWGVAHIDEATVVTEFFRIVHV